MKGSIAPGKLADLVVLSDDVFEVPPAEILKVQVDLAMLGGRIIHERQGQQSGT